MNEQILESVVEWHLLNKASALDHQKYLKIKNERKNRKIRCLLHTHQLTKYSQYKEEISQWHVQEVRIRYTTLLLKLIERVQWEVSS